MVKKKQTTKKVRTRVKSEKPEDNSVYFLKLTVFLILGAQWIYIENLPDWQLPIPIGLLVGLVLATHEHFQIDRKIEYAVLLIASFVSFWLPIGLVIQV